MNSCPTDSETNAHGQFRLVEARCRLSDLSALLPGHATGDGVGDLEGNQRAARLSRVGSASMRSGSRRSIPRRWRTSATTSATTATSIRCSERSPISTALVAAAHARGLKVILDFVPNHTSDRHPWFVESRASRGNPKRDWYIWRDPRPDGGPPNNWLSRVRRRRPGRATARTGQYYLPRFLPKQPDLNWRNPDVRTAMYDVLRFWLDRGVDGFRVDVIWLLIRMPRLRDNPPNPNYRPTRAGIHRFMQVYSADQPETHEVVAEMRAVSRSNMTSAC